jgi:hypothetical protein
LLQKFWMQLRPQQGLLQQETLLLQPLAKGSGVGLIASSCRSIMQQQQQQRRRQWVVLQMLPLLVPLVALPLQHPRTLRLLLPLPLLPISHPPAAPLAGSAATPAAASLLSRQCLYLIAGGQRGSGCCCWGARPSTGQQ